MSSLQSLRFLHTGDLHLDSPVEGLSSEAPPEVLAILRGATNAAWPNVVRAAIEHRVDFVVIAGEVFEVASPTLLGQTRFRDGLAELADAGIASFVVDDILVNFDADRAERAADAIRHLAERHQVLFFSCHRPMARLMDPDGGRTVALA